MGVAWCESNEPAPAPPMSALPTSALPASALATQSLTKRSPSKSSLAASAAPGSSISSRDGVLVLLLRAGQATAAELASQLAISVQATRRHLRSLEEEGLVEASPTPEGPGRPSNHWRLTSQGQARFPNGSEHFALGLMRSLAGQLPPEAIRQLLEQQAIAKADDYRRQIGNAPLAERLEQLVALRRGEGYVAECQPDPERPGSWLLSEFHCSVIKIAEQFPCVCDQELQLIRHTFPDCAVERVHWRLQGGHACGFRLGPA